MQDITIARQLFRLQLITLLIGLALMAAKFLAWWITGSNAILSDALESIINIVAGAFGLYSLLLAAKPKDRNHPYGHGKIEFLSAGLEGTLISIAGMLVIGKAVYNLLYPQELHELKLGAYLTAATGAINFAMGMRLESQGKKQDSLILRASGQHLQTDAWSSLGILIGLATVLITRMPVLDNILAITFGFFILYSGYGLVRHSIAGIMDEADHQLMENLVDKLQVHRSENWVDLHNFRMIKYGGNLHIDCHLTLPRFLDTHEAHQEVKAMEHQAKSFHHKPIEWFIHVDPCEPASCPLCAKSNCPIRHAPFQEQVTWTLANVMKNAPHDLNSSQPS